ncbi:MAG: hypothetical protein AAFV43_13830 [Planctomycetota bacterium]
MRSPTAAATSRVAASLGFVALGGVAALLAGDRVGGLLASTAAVALPAAMLAMLLALPLAMQIAKGRGARRFVSLVALVGLLLLPPHVIAAGWTAAAMQSEWLFTPATPSTPSWFVFAGYRGAVLLHAIYGTPWAAALSSIALFAVDARKEEQALVEAPAWRVLVRVTLPSAGAGLLAAGGLVAVLAATEIAITDLVRVRTFAEEVYTQAAAGAFATADDWRASGGRRIVAGGAVLAAVAGAISVVFVHAARTTPTETRDPHALPPRLIGGRSAFSIIAWATLVLLLAVPTLALLQQAGRMTVESPDGPRRGWAASAALREFAAAPLEHRRELLVSAGLATATATTVVAGAASIVWAVRNRPRVRSAAFALLVLAGATPGPLLAILAVRLFNQPADGWLAPLGWMYDGGAMPWLVQSVRLAPIGAAVLAPIAWSTPIGVLAAAELDGAGPFARFLRVVCPIHAATLAGCWAAIFALAFGELAATALVVPPGPPPIAVRLLSLMHYGVEERVAALALWFLLGGVLLALAVVAAASQTPNRAAHDHDPPDRR